ncbi:hypothetical protein CGRA01v4_07832 [Colletotrichum graminicola]|nr:hypothetical protein CGRA01v4_07832 [Colletotrichum graminicola]
MNGSRPPMEPIRTVYPEPLFPSGRWKLHLKMAWPHGTNTRGIRQSRAKG